LSDTGELVVRQQEWRYWALLAAGHVTGIAFILLLSVVSGRSAVPWLVAVTVLLGFQYAVALRHRKRRWSDPPVCIVRPGEIGWGPTGAVTWVARPPLESAEVRGRFIAHVRFLGADGAQLHPRRDAFYGFFSPKELRDALRSAGWLT